MPKTSSPLSSSISATRRANLAARASQINTHNVLQNTIKRRNGLIATAAKKTDYLFGALPLAIDMQAAGRVFRVGEMLPKFGRSQLPLGGSIRARLSRSIQFHRMVMHGTP